MAQIIVVVHLGATESCYAFSYRNKPTEMYSHNSFLHEERHLTSVLVDTKGTFYTFGSHAETYYVCLAEENKHKGWRLFKRFRTTMKITTGTPLQFTVEDCEGGTCPALNIFVMAIESLLKIFVGCIKESLSFLMKLDCIRFVFTVPDAWRDDGKQFIKEAAIQAGINGNQLELTFESEAAATWCTIAVNDGRQLQLPGHKFIVINQYGNFIDVTVVHTLPNGNMKSIFQESLEGISVQMLFIEYFEKIVGNGILEEFCRLHPNVYLELINDLRKYDIEQLTNKKRLKIPVKLHKLVCNQCKLKLRDIVVGDKMRINRSDLQDILQVHATRLVNHIKERMSQTDLKEIQSVLLVGDIATSKCIQDRFKENLSGINVFAPEDKWATVKGALLFGHKSASSSRNRSTNERTTLPPNVISKKTVITNSKIPRKKFLVVAAFDFGTTYSGYAYSYENEVGNVTANKPWHSNDASASLSSLKTPTSLLLDPKGQFHSFGFKAEDEFARLLEENKHDGWRLFRRFKMILHNNENLSRYMNVEDIEGRTFPAMTIFAMSIKYLKVQLLEAITLQTPNIEESDIQYVLTVPAIWDVGATQFMREAAEEAGIDSDRLLLAFESEVAALWCALHYKRDFQQLIGSKYIVIDLGGGTADISVHERPSDNAIKVINQASGGAWGGTKVDEQFFEYLEKILGNGVLEELRKNNLEDYYMLTRTFENKKRSDPIISGHLTTVQLPVSLLQITRDRKKESTHTEETGQNIKDKIRIESSTVKGWFDTTVNPLIKHIKTLMKKDTIKDVKTIMLVGGFAESVYVQNRLKDELTGINVIVPEKAGLAVVNGAVMYGQNPDIFASRVLKYTYGIEVYGDFEDNIHPAEKGVFVDGKWKVENCFHIFVRADDMVTVDHCVTHFITPLARVSLISVYKSISNNPRYTTDFGCKHLGTLMIENPENIPLNLQEKEVTFMFGNTEIFVKVKNLETGHEERLTIDCL